MDESRYNKRAHGTERNRKAARRLCGAPAQARAVWSAGVSDKKAKAMLARMEFSKAARRPAAYAARPRRRGPFGPLA